MRRKNDRTTYIFVIGLINDNISCACTYKWYVFIWSLLKNLIFKIFIHVFHVSYCYIPYSAAKWTTAAL